jgi:MFS family permease
LTDAGRHRGLAVLGDRDFALYLSARFLASIASQMLVIAVGWQVYQITGRLLDLGLIGLSQFLPFLLLVFIAGHAADRYERRRILLFCGCVQFLCAAALLVFALVKLAVIWPIFIVLAFLGVARAFQMPATQSFLPNLVPAGALQSAIAVSSSTFQVATIAGPSVGGLLYAFAEARPAVLSGAALTYAVAAGFGLLAVLLIAGIRQRRVPAAPAAATWESLLGGVRFVWRRKPVLGAISLDLFAVLFGGATALLPAFTRDVLHGGPEVFGYLRTAPGIGAGLTALVLAAKPIERRVGPYMFMGVGAFGAATVVFGLTTHFWIAAGALLVLGAGDMISVFIRQVLVQLETPDAIRGRVSAVNAVFIGASNELGEFESGVTAAWLGLVPAIVAGGALTLAIGALWAFVLFPALWRMQTFRTAPNRGE